MLEDARRVVERVHEATIHATSLLNLHVRKSLADGTPIDRIFDGNAAYNVGTQLRRLLRGDGPIHAMTDEDKEFHRHNLCLTCDGEVED